MSFLDNFDPNGVGYDNGCYFGLSFVPEESELVLISAPWDVTTSYGGGACNSPDAIIEASTQIDLYEPFAPGVWRRGIATASVDYSILERSNVLREDARKIITCLEDGRRVDSELNKRRLDRVNKGSEELNDKIYNQTKTWLDRGKLVGLVGGDHSTPYGIIKAIAEKEGSIGLLHIDAHADLRVAYGGFIHSHASIMYNVSKLEGVSKIVQVALRDVCDGEVEYAQNSNGQIVQFFDCDLFRNSAMGESWDSQCNRIIEELPEKVYISFDIDGLSPDNAPHTGTPVPGGLSFNQAIYLLNKIAENGRRIVGFDMCEVSPSINFEWDANVGARILYKLANFMLKTNQ